MAQLEFTHLDGKIVFVFPGHGQQWLGMALELLDSSPLFAERMRECDKELSSYVEWSMLDVLRGAPGAPPLERIDVLQPVLFAVMVSLAAMWQDSGVEPDAVVGHSIGELAAACVAGALPLRDAARVAVLWSKAHQRLVGHGGMVAVQLPIEQVDTRLQRWDGRLSVAAVNGPSSVVVVGSVEALEGLLAECEAEGVWARNVAIDYPAHSAHVEELREQLLSTLSGITPRSASIPFYSGIIGQQMDTTRLDAEYWYRNSRQMAQFEQATRTLLADGYQVFIEVSAHPVLIMSLQETFEAAGASAIAVGSLRRNAGVLDQFLRSLTEVYIRGVSLLGEQDQVLLDLLQAIGTSVLGRDIPNMLDTQRPFKDLGFDSLASVEFRNRLSAMTGLHLPSALLYNYPTPAALVRHLRAVALGIEDEVSIVKEPSVTDNEPIAIIGMSCRYPGGVASPEDLWRLVVEGRNVVGAFPTNRGWDIESLYDPDPDAIDKCYTRSGGFLYNAGDFDADFFAISPHEALAMDPQQRLLLETAWETLERAGIAPASLRGSQTGVFVGATSQDYGPRLHEPAGGLGGYVLTGTTASVLSGRLAYTFGLEGPTVTIDTACSSSLVALHLAAQALRQNECQLALAGGVTVMATSGMFVEFSRQRGLSPDGLCKAFAASADGTGWSEGVGLVLLERLSDARRNGHQILAVLRGSAINQDGASNGLTAPNGLAQQRVIQQALANARLTPADVDVVEAHGTGTKLGDPIEAQAILATYGQNRPDDQPLRLGSLKSNIGHTQAAAGVGGVIKMIMAMRHGILPRTLHIDQPTPHVDWTKGSVCLLTQAIPWKETAHPRRAAVSSFGISGTNAHVILEQAPDIPVGAHPCGRPPWDSTSLHPTDDHKGAPLREVPWVISALSQSALQAQASQLHAFVTSHPDHSLSDIGSSLATTRSPFQHRAVVVAREREGFLDGLATLASGEMSMHVAQGRTHHTGKMAFLFTGGGSQYLGMGRDLSRTYPVFAQALDEVCTHLDTHLQRPIRAVMWASEDSADASLLDQIAFMQSALFALEVALFRLLTHWGLVPDFLMGHSLGELTAAHVAGVLSLPDAAKLVVTRGRLMQARPSGGAMLSLQASADEVQEQLAGCQQQVSIAAINGPASTVIAGDEDAVLRVANTFEKRGRKTKRLKISHASHSPHMDEILAPFRQVAEGLTFRTPTLPIISNVTGERAADDLVCSPEYWVQHVRQAVRFCDSIRSLQKAGVTTYIELGPDAVLTTLAEEGLTDETTQPVVLVPVLRGGHAETHTLQMALAHAHIQGATLNWQSIFPGAQRVDLPTYPFQHQRYWLDLPTPASDATRLGLTPTHHPFLGASLQQASGDGLLLTGQLSLHTHPWLADHALTGIPFLPGTAFVELALAAGDQVGCDRVEELTLHTPLPLPEHGALQLQIAVGGSNDNGHRPLSIYARQADDRQNQPWTQHAAGWLSTSDPSIPADLSVFPPVTATRLKVSALYEHLTDLGYHYGPAFQGLQAVWQDGQDLYAQVQLADEQTPLVSRFGIHPVLLDLALHPLFLQTQQIQLPFCWTGVSLHTTGATAVRVRLSQISQESISLTLADPTGMPVATIASLTLRPLPSHQLTTAPTDALYALNWRTLSPVSAPALPSPHRWAIVGSDPLHLQQTLAAEHYADLTALNQSMACGHPVPDIVLVTCLSNPDDDIPTAVHTTTHQVLRLIQDWLRSSHLSTSRLLFITCGALAPTPADAIEDLAASAIWGMVRSAQTEHPNTFVLADVDLNMASHLALSAALTTDEPQMALREGLIHVPRLAPLQTKAPNAAPLLDPNGTVLITGGTGALGQLFARHLVTIYGVRHLLLTSRRGMSAQGAAQFARELSTQGAHVQIVACDAADRQSLAQLLMSLPTEHPLVAVIHTAGVLDDAAIGSLSPQRIDAVLRPKVDTAWHLHQLTEHLNLSAFVLFSSITGIIGNAGQANYTAANTFLDALAQYRKTRGLPATSLAWGLWEQTEGMAGPLSQTDLARFAHAGLVPLSEHEGLALFDMSRNVDQALLVAAKLSVSARSPNGQVAEVAVVLQDLLQTSMRRAASQRTSPAKANGQLSWAQRTASLSQTERDRAMTELVRTTITSVLGHAPSASIDINREFRALGFDSLAALQLRNRLNTATGLRLPVTIVFDYPTPIALINYLRQTQLVPDQAATSQSIFTDLDKLEATLLARPIPEQEHAKVTARLQALLRKWNAARNSTETNIATDGTLQAATDDELFETLDKELGSSAYSR